MPKKSKKSGRLAFELKRKLFHALGVGYVLVFIISELLFGYQIALLILLSTLLTFITIEFFRIKEHMKIPVFHTLWRPKEENTLGGQVYFILGIILAFAIFDYDIALTVILMTVFGDMAAALFGIAFGRNWIKSLPDTAWEGVIAEFVVDMIIGLIILQNIWIAFAMAAVATIAETVFPHVDDNLAIPVFSGFVGQSLKLLIR